MNSRIRSAMAMIAMMVSGLAYGHGGDEHAPVISAPEHDGATPWTSLNADDADSDFHFVVVTDRTGGARPDVFRKAMPKVNLLEPAFVVSVGDLIEGYTDDQAQLDTEWNEMADMIDQLNAPFFYTAGNHDMSNAVMAETWQSRFGPSYYHFNYKDVFFLVLNSELFGMVGSEDTPVPGPYKQVDQMAFIESALADNADARWTVVLVHQPLWDMSNIDPDWTKVEELLGDREYTVFAGHYHAYKKSVRNDRNFITLATTGGGSALRGPLYGEFDHVAWVTMREDGPTIANVLLDGVEPDDVATTESRDMIAKLSAAITSEPRYETGRRPAGGQFVFNVSNPGAVPMTVAASGADSDDVRITSVSDAVTLQAGESALLVVQAKVKGRQAFADLLPASVTFDISTSLDGRPFEFSSVQAIYPQKQQTLSRVRQPIVVDGDLSEWRKLRFSASKQGDFDPEAAELTASDISFDFDLRFDDDNVYLAVEVTDDQVIASDQRPALGQDAIIVTLDTQALPERLINKGLVDAATDGTLFKMAFDILTVGGEAPMPAIEFLQASRDELSSSGARTETGYTVEWAVPREVLKARGTDIGEGVRLSIHAQDFDEGDRAPKNWYWGPSRFGDTPVSGSGMFVVEGE